MMTSYVQSAFMYVSVGVWVVCIIVILLDIMCKCINKQHIYKTDIIIVSFFYLYDQISHIFAGLHIYYDYCNHNLHQYNIMLLYLFIASIIFTVLPVILSLFQLHNSINKTLITNKYAGKIIKHWLKQYSMLLYALSILFGSSFAGILLVNVC